MFQAITFRFQTPHFYLGMSFFVRAVFSRLKYHCRFRVAKYHPALTGSQLTRSLKRLITKNDKNSLPIPCHPPLQCANFDIIIFFDCLLQSGVSIVRELHVYGSVVPVSARDPTKFQHQGFGTLLMEEAERIARDEHGANKISVISGVGTRNYYRYGHLTILFCSPCKNI